VAQKTVVTFDDDLDGSQAEGTVTFALNGVQYELDLSKKKPRQAPEGPGTLRLRRPQGQRQDSGGSRVARSGFRAEAARPVGCP
jgi:hypothetical protein